MVRATSSFEEGFDELFARAFRVGRRILGDSAAAEDVAAEAMARAYAHWRKIGDEPWREGWVVRVATNLALDAARSRSRMTDAQATEQGREDDDVAVRLALVEAMARLPKRQREVVALRHLAGLSEAETAAALRVSTGSVKTHMSRGIAALRSRMGESTGVEMTLEGVAADE
jgi:RNA polymerase sigma-70 factor (ECF subfamily)